MSSAYEGVYEEEKVRDRGEGHHCVAQSVVLSVLQQQLTQRLHEEEKMMGRWDSDGDVDRGVVET